VGMDVELYGRESRDMIENMYLMLAASESLDVVDLSLTFQW